MCEPRTALEIVHWEGQHGRGWLLHCEQRRISLIFRVIWAHRKREVTFKRDLCNLPTILRDILQIFHLSVLIINGRTQPGTSKAGCEGPGWKFPLFRSRNKNISYKYFNLWQITQMSIFWLFLTQEGHTFAANGVLSAINPAAHECVRLEIFCKLENRDAPAPNVLSSCEWSCLFQNCSHDWSLTLELAW